MHNSERVCVWGWTWCTHTTFSEGSSSKTPGGRLEKMFPDMLLQETQSCGGDWDMLGKPKVLSHPGAANVTHWSGHPHPHLHPVPTQS